MRFIYGILSESFYDNFILYLLEHLNVISVHILFLFMKLYMSLNRIGYRLTSLIFIITVCPTVKLYKFI